MPDQAETSVEHLLAEWADILRHRHGFHTSKVARFSVSYGASAEGEDAVTYGAQSSDAELILTLAQLFRRDIDARLAELESALAEVGITVKRPV